MQHLVLLEIIKNISIALTGTGLRSICREAVPLVLAIFLDRLIFVRTSTILRRATAQDVINCTVGR
jgi:hypothetical protein